MKRWLACLLALVVAACGASPRPALEAAQPTAPTSTDTTAPKKPTRDYWPTHGWRTARPEDHGVDPAMLKQADDAIFSQLPNVYSLLIVRHGYIVFEKYYAGSDETASFGLRSATKSFASAMIGIALRDGYLKSVDQRLGDLLPEYFTRTNDLRKAEITVRHLLNMTSGFEWDESNAYLRLAPGVPVGQSVVDLPLANPPGQVFNYNSAASQLLSILFTRLTGQTMWEVAARELFEPIGIPNTHWPADRDGNSEAYSGLVMPARELAKFGFLYLNGGAWDGRQVIPADYVRASTSWDEAVTLPNGGGYGFLWWLASDRRHDAFYAAGYGGQYVYVAPDLDLLVVMTGNPQLQESELRPSRYVITDYILPAVTADAKLGHS